MRLVFALPAILLVSGPLHVQPLDLVRALALADTLSTSSRMALHKVEEARGDLRAASAAYLPSVRLEGAWGATTDPLGAFAGRLGQRRTSVEDFNPAKLNDPNAVPVWTAGVVTEVPLINVDAWKQVALASGQMEARRLESQRSLQRLHSDVIKAWHGLAVAKQSARAWAKAAEAARTARRNALSASEQGMADRSKNQTTQESKFALPAHIHLVTSFVLHSAICRRQEMRLSSLVTTPESMVTYILPVDVSSSIQLNIRFGA